MATASFVSCYLEGEGHETFLVPVDVAFDQGLELLTCCHCLCSPLSLTCDGVRPLLLSIQRTHLAIRNGILQFFEKEQIRNFSKLEPEQVEGVTYSYLRRVFQVSRVCFGPRFFQKPFPKREVFLFALGGQDSDGLWFVDEDWCDLFNGICVQRELTDCSPQAIYFYVINLNREQILGFLFF